MITAENARKLTEEAVPGIADKELIKSQTNKQI